jgi:hypothetical protein
MSRAFSAAAYATGRRARSGLYAGRIGTIVKVRLPVGLDDQVSYDIAWDDEGGVEKVAQSLLQGPTWEILPQVMKRAEVESIHRRWLEHKLHQRSEQARQRMLAAGIPEKRYQDVAFYKPSESYLKSSLLARLHQDALTDPKTAAKALREEFANEFPGVKYTVQTKGEQVVLTWTDGPVFVSQIVDKYILGKPHGVGALISAPPPQAGRVNSRREISNELLESAIEYVRQMIEEPLTGVKAEHYRSGALRDFYPRHSNAYSSLSVGQLIRLVLLRWDDYDRHFIAEGLTRAMVMENKALFPEKDLSLANVRMRHIRGAVDDLVDRSQESSFDHARESLTGG